MEWIGLSPIDVDGLHGDKWCAPVVRVRAKAERSSSSLRATVWLKGDADDNTAFQLKILGKEGQIARVPFDTLTTVDTPVDVEAGEDLSFSLICAHKVQTDGTDQRELSFVLNRMELL